MSINDRSFIKKSGIKILKSSLKRKAQKHQRMIGLIYIKLISFPLV